MELKRTADLLKQSQAELLNANRELIFQNKEKEKRAAELMIANKELLFQNKEKEKRSAELVIANKELLFQNEEKGKRAAELAIANKELVFQNEEKGKQQADSDEMKALNRSIKLVSQYSRSLIEASLDPLVTISAEGKITDVNEASIKVTGVGREVLTGSDFSTYFTEPKKAKAGYEQVFKNGFVSDYPLTIKHRSGKLTDVLYNASLYKDDKGNVLGVFAAARDITHQKQISHYARSLIEASLDPLVTINTEGKIMDVNEAMIKATDKSREKLCGTLFSSYFVESANAAWVHKEVFEKGYVLNYPLTIIDGVLTDVILSGSVYKDMQGITLGAVLVARDITHLKKIEKELIEAKIFAELATSIAEDEKMKAVASAHVSANAVKSKQQFLSNMSHEIRTPMNAIIGFTKVLLKTELTVKQKEYLTAIKLSGDALIVLINDILDLAKVDAGKMTFEQTPFKLALSVAAMLHLFDTKIQEKNLELIYDYDTRIPAVLVGDPIRLHQVILNLVSNAVKFTSKGKITVTVKMIQEDEEKVTVAFAISDTGIGVASDKLDRIFENFQQASSITSRLYGGTGLGLAIVKHLVEAQGGSIEVKSVVNEGATFSFLLHFKKTNATVMPDTEIMALDREIKEIKILVVEDMALNQLLMKTLLDEFGFARDIVSNGKLAIEKMKTTAYDIILMDLQMPEMNGFETTEYIRNTMKSSIPIIALTADVTTVDLEKCKAAGMNDYIAKPVDERLLYSKIVGHTKKPVVIVSKEMLLEAIDEKKVIKYIDLKYLNQRTKSNPVLMMEMIALYLNQTPPLINLMTNSFLNKDWSSLQSSVHKMIPSFSIMGINPDYEVMAQKVQEFAVNQLHAEGIHGLVLQLENVLNESCKELQEEYAIMKIAENENYK
ncbi:MAG: ATP-binding protein [Chitinophagaceae bacterium]